jgi:hypothetical protein
LLCFQAIFLTPLRQLPSFVQIGFALPPHAKFFELMEAHQSPIAPEAVERIAVLYQIEKEIRGHPPEERRKVRNTRARPLLDSMRTWLQASLRQLAPKSENGVH